MDFKITANQQNFCIKNFTSDYPIWNQLGCVIFNNKYSRKQLNDAFNNAIRINDSLRLNVVQKSREYYTYVSDFKYSDFPFFCFNSEDELLDKTKELVNEPINFNGALVKCVTFNTPNRSGCILCAHHIIVDGFSLPILASHIYEFLQNNTKAIDIIDPYVDYIKKNESYKSSNRYNRDRKFWENQFLTEPTCSIPFQNYFSFDYTSSEQNGDLSNETFVKIKKFCDENDISLNSYFDAICSLFISRKYEVDNFTVGTPVLNRTTATELNTVGLYMHILPLICNMKPTSFVEFAKKTEDNKLNLFRHQKFTQTDIKDLLKEKGIEKNNLFDVAFSYQDFTPNENYELIFQYSNALSLPLEIHLQSFNNKKHNLKIRYRTTMFTEQEIEDMLKSIIALLENAVENPDKIIYELEMASKEEKQKILNDFNDTAVEYEKDKSIHELFEEQAERTPDKIALVASDKKVTYRELNEEANRIANSLIEKGIGKGDIVGLMLPRKSYLLSALFGILKTGAAYLPIAPDNPKDRIEYILKDSSAKYCITEEKISEFLSNTNTESPQISVKDNSACYCIYTSGSTGKPKGTLITHRNAINYVSRNDFNVFGGIIKEEKNILSVTTIGFDIFVTESLLPLTNGLTVILADEEEAKIQAKLNSLALSSNAEVIQTTPTKMKSLLNDKKHRDYLNSLKIIILGGESLDSSLVAELQQVTNAKIFNIYGPTETTVWSSFTEITHANDITIGKPIANTQIYVIDKYLNPVPIGVMGELCIAGDGVCAGYLNRPDLTAEKFIDNPFGSGKMYKTGDHAYWREDGNLVYIGRKDFQVKIRGLRIELGEIESAIQAIEEIERAVVVVRKDSEDRQLICAFYTGKEFNAKELREQLSKSLPKYMIPHIFTHLEEMPMTASGKANRNALPEIDLNNISTETEYVAPQTQEEKALTQAIENVLDAENVSVLENFFDMGGDSLKSIELVSELEEKGYTVNVKAIFEAKDIQSLAKELTLKTEAFEHVEYNHILPATAAQMRVYTAQMLNTDSTHYNVTYAFKAENINKEKLEIAVNKLIERHESLRTHFETINGTVHQVIDEQAFVKIQVLSKNTNDFIQPFDLSTSPLMRVGCNEDTVILDFNHIIVDGESMPVFFKELNELYMGRALPDTVQYGEFAVTDKYTEQNEKYWLNIFEDEITTLELPTDYPRPEQQSFEGSQIYELIDIETHNRIAEKCKELNITPYVFYMTCYNILLSKFSNNEDICVGMPISGRSSKFLNTIGMFVNTIALRNRVEGNKTIKTLLNEVKEASISAIDNQNYPFGELTKKLNIERNGRNPIFDVMFAYQSFEMTDITLDDKKVELLPTINTSSKCDMSFYVLPRNNDVVLTVEYSTELFKEETINNFISSFKSLLNTCLDETKLIKDISVLSDEENNTILNTFNDTAYTYDIPDGSTLYSMFEKASEKNKDKVCIKANDEEITFGEFKAYAERIDGKIRNVTNGEKSVIAIICERSFEMYGAVYGIIRGGNAYLPIDPNYPQERIDYILSNSNAKAVVTQEKFCHLAGNVPCIDATEILKSTEQPESTPILANEEDTAYVIYTSGSTGNPKGAKISHKSAINRILWMHDFYPLEENDVILQKTPYTFDVSVWELFWWGITGRTLCASKPDEHFLPAKILEETEKNKVTHLHFVPSVFDLFLTYLENNPEEQSKFNSVKYVFLSGEALSANHIKRFYNIYDYNKVSLHNLYGPTECAVDVSYYPCVPTDIDPVPIGKPIYNTQLYIVDKYLNPTLIGVTGELCIAGVNVGQGYLNNEQLTNEKFIDNPFGEGKLYRTGDLAYWRNDGQICYVGRMDGQIKLNGQRIELGEIEKVIGEISGVEAVAVIIKQNNGQDVLVAFCCGNENSIDEIKKHCESKLPQYMIPSKIEFIEKMPLNQSGKLDRKTLKNIDVLFDDTAIKEAPVTDNEKLICELFQNILNIDFVGRNESFFALGGTSLDMILVLSEDLLKNISAADFIANPTPEKLAALLEEERVIETEYLELLYSAPAKEKALVLFPYAGGGAESYANFVASIKKYADNISVYFVRYLHSQEECTKAAEEIEKALGGKQIYFYSHCVGSAVAMQILNILEGCGKNIVRHFISGGFIPNGKPMKWNSWNITPDFVLRNILVKAGAPLTELSKNEVKLILKEFRHNTDFSTQYYYGICKKISCPVSLVINKDDPFTTQHSNAKELWERYTDNTVNVHYIDPTSHYFQSDNSDTLVKIILEIAE